MNSYFRSSFAKLREGCYDKQSKLFFSIFISSLLQSYDKLIIDPDWGRIAVNCQSSSKQHQ